MKTLTPHRTLLSQSVVIIGDGAPFVDSYADAIKSLNTRKDADVFTVSRKGAGTFTVAWTKCGSAMPYVTSTVLAESSEEVELAILKDIEKSLALMIVRPEEVDSYLVPDPNFDVIADEYRAMAEIRPDLADELLVLAAEAE